MDRTDPWGAALVDLLHRSHLLSVSALPGAINHAVRPLGIEITIYVVDHEQRRLRPLPGPGAADAVAINLDSTLAGRAYMQVETIPASVSQRLWVPVIDGTERLGVLDVVLADGMGATDPAVRTGCVLLAGLIGHLITGKRVYGDSLHLARRSRPMDVSAELLWQMLPPLTFATPRAVITAALEPCYEVGGDAFDYAVDEDVARVAVLDGLGHGLPAAMTTVLALAALRASRRDGQDMAAMGKAADDAITRQFRDSRFVTAVLAELDTVTGSVHYLNAGHPPPVILRHGKAVATLTGGRRLPLGLPDTAAVAEAMLEPGDRLLLYTDGVTEARGADGSYFGLDRLVDLAERGSAADLPTAETLRRLCHAVLDHQQGRLQDDASLLMIEWSPAAASRAVPG